MQPREFADRVAAHPDLVPGEGPRDDRIYVVHETDDGVRTGWEIELQAIRDNSWGDLEGVLTCQRAPEIMQHLSRIVGYYSNIRNWNASKVAELRDRRKGNYGVPE